MVTKRQAAKKTGDIKSFAIFLVICGAVVLVATYPWVLAIAAGLGVFLYFRNERFKTWVSGKLLKKKI